MQVEGVSKRIRVTCLKIVEQTNSTLRRRVDEVSVKLPELATKVHLSVAPQHLGIGGPLA